MLDMIALISGSANAAWMSAARSCGVAPTLRVVGYSTGSSCRSARSRCRPRSWTCGNTPGPAHEGDRMATVSPGWTTGGRTREGREDMRVTLAIARLRQEALDVRGRLDD